MICQMRDLRFQILDKRRQMEDGRGVGKEPSFRTGSERKSKVQGPKPKGASALPPSPKLISHRHFNEQRSYQETKGAPSSSRSNAPRSRKKAWDLVRIRRVTTLNNFFMSVCLMKLVTGLRRTLIFLDLCPVRSGLRALSDTASSQVAGFSPVRTVLHVFHPISQPEGFDFSPVTKICPEKFSDDSCIQ